MKIGDYLEREYNYDKSITDTWKGYIYRWRSWYQGDVKDFHSYKIYNGKKTIKMQRLSMQMAKKCCEDWADTLFNERVKIEVEGERANEILFDTLESLNFWEFCNQAVEQSGSVGTGAIVVSVGNIEVDENGSVSYENGNINIDYINAENIYPLSWNNGRVTECAFAVKKMIKGQFYILLSVHHYGENGNMIMTNKIFKADNSDDIIELDFATTEEMGIVETFDTGNTIPWFAIIKPAGVNNINPDVPFGMPYYAQSIDTLKRIDNTFDALQNEVSLGRKRIFMREEMVSVDVATGESVDVFDPNDIAVYIIPKGFNATDFFHAENSSIRTAELTTDLQNSLAIFGDKVGFGVQYYQLDPTGQVREVGILTQNSKMIRRKAKHEISLESTLHDVISAIMYIIGMSNEHLKITFDSDIIDDENQRKQTALMELSSGVMGKAEYRMMFYGEPEERAKEVIEEIKAESAVDFGFGDEPFTD